MEILKETLLNSPHLKPNCVRNLKFGKSVKYNYNIKKNTKITSTSIELNK